MDVRNLNSFSTYLINAFAKPTRPQKTTAGIRVNQVVSEIASWYEKLRNAVEYREDEMILRAAIERILKRRLILGGNGKSVASPLVRELIWARYFPDGSVLEETIEKLEKIIDLYLKLREHVTSQHILRESEMNTWMFQLMSSRIEHVLHPQPDKEAMVNFMFHILKDNITIVDDNEQTRDAQVFIAIRRAYAKNDLALLRYHLFREFFGNLSEKTLHEAASRFQEAYREIQKHLSYPLRFKIFSYVKKQTPPFLILDDILTAYKGGVEDLLHDEIALRNAVFQACQKRYSNIASKVRRAIIRSVIFILLSKALFAFAIEGTYENYFYGRVIWGSIALNIAIPPFLMVFVGLLIKTPDQKNSERILERISTLLFDSHPILGYPVKIRHIPKKTASFLDIIFTALWLGAFIASFGLVIFTLSKLHFNIVSQTVFLFFLAIVTFLAYRINRTAHIYTVEDRQGLLTPIIDFFFMPIAQVGRYLTEGIAQINILLFVLDFIIETPFKSIFAFFEQWFFYLHTKREYLE